MPDVVIPAAGEDHQAARVVQSHIWTAGRPAWRCPGQGQHSITIEQGNQRRTVAVPELTDNTNLKELVRFLQRKADELRRKARTGSAP